MLPLVGAVRYDPCRLSKAATVYSSIRLPFCSLKKMNPAQRPTPGPAGFSSITAEKPFGNIFSAGEAKQSSGETSISENQSQFSNEEDFPSLDVNMGCSSKVWNSNKKRTRIDSGSNYLRQEAIKSSEPEGIASLQEEQSLPCQFGKKFQTRYVHTSPSSQSKFTNVMGTKNSDCSEDLRKVERFDICLPRTRSFITQEILRPGMVLLKRYISLRDQINIVKTCQALGEGPGGFYRPGYKDGAKLSLHMMCLGLNWDPQTRKYDKRHPVDDCEPPNIPHEFHVLVQRAIQDAHYLIKKDSHILNPEDVLPSMSPDICIVNFYTRYGKLGLHQDRDESRESLQRGLPVVSWSIGDSAKFLYGDQRDVEQAENVLLESGDVLLFGGESRMVFHGVPSIIPFSAPEALLAETGLRRSRLNLTFRQC